MESSYVLPPECQEKSCFSPVLTCFQKPITNFFDGQDHSPSSTFGQFISRTPHAKKLVLGGI
jgi:hypothetical protein